MNAKPQLHQGATLTKRLKVVYSGYDHHPDKYWQNTGFTVFQDADGNEFIFSGDWAYEAYRGAYITATITIKNIKHRPSGPVYYLSECRQHVMAASVKAVPESWKAQRYVIVDDTFEAWVSEAVAQAQARPVPEYTRSRKPRCGANTTTMRTI